MRRDANTLWSGSFDREVKDLPVVQDSIIRAIRAALKVRDAVQRLPISGRGASAAAGGRPGFRRRRGACVAFLLTRRGLNKVAHDISNASKRGASDVNSRAMAATEQGVRAKEPFFNTIWLPCDPMFAALHSRPAFAAFGREMGATMCPADARWPIAPRK